ncbi:MAG: hypothetical protein IIW21_02175 [Clostridia bacterium]|nr:hypothetical protein [Clostridia bacterium]
MRRRAGKLCDSYPDHNVIITTHAYLFRDGTTLDENDVCPPSGSGNYNNGDDMWDKLVSKHENIVLVISGHDPSDLVVLTQTEGEGGNVVSQLLVDPQTTDKTYEGLGMVAMLYFSEDGQNVTLQYYSTTKNMLFRSVNQFSFTLDTVGARTAVTEEMTEAPQTEGIQSDAPITAEPQTEAPSADNTEGNMTSTVIISALAGAVTATVAVLAVTKSKKKKG